ncbi:MAG: type II toxin-antitoxin system CcdA family antitoxin [Novosphingobium sp.]
MVKSSASATRKATNVSLDADLLEQARELDINISRACESGLVEQISKARSERWLAENADAIDSYNKWVERNELPLAHYRQF